MKHVLEVLFSVVAVGLNIVFVWPQAVKLLKSRDLSGVSPGTWTISIALFSVWAVFALRTSYWFLFVANVSSFVAAVVIMVLGIKCGWRVFWPALSLAAVVSAFLFGVFIPAVLAAVMTVAGVALRVPQLLALLRAKTTSGVAAATWWLSAATAGTWLVVSSLRGATAVIVANSSALGSSLVLLGVLYWRRRAESQPAPGQNTF